MVDRNCAARRPKVDSAGFTLLEIALVIVIISIFVGLVAPRLTDSSRQELQAQGRRLVMTFKLLRSEAILHETEYRLNYDLDQERYFITSQDRRTNLNNITTELGILGREKRLLAPVQIADIEFPTYGVKVAQGGGVYTTFSPDGSVDPCVIHLATDTQAVTLAVNPMNSRLEMTLGYHEPHYE